MKERREIGFVTNHLERPNGVGNNSSNSPFGISKNMEHRERGKELESELDNYKGYSRIVLAGNATTIGVICHQDETFTYLKPYLANESVGEVEIVRLEENMPSKVATGSIILNQPVSDDYILNIITHVD